MATEAVDRPFRAVIEQFEPKQRPSANIDHGPPKHADFALQSRRAKPTPLTIQNRREFDESSAILNLQASFRVVSPSNHKLKMRGENGWANAQRAAANGAARLFTFDKPEAASADIADSQCACRDPANYLAVSRQHRG
jgi:hypothetical protein